MGADPTTRLNLLWGVRKDSAGWSLAQTTAIYWLQCSALKSARAWTNWARRRRQMMVLRSKRNVMEPSRGIGRYTQPVGLGRPPYLVMGFIGPVIQSLNKSF